MADLWGDFEADAATIIQADGDTVTWSVGIDDTDVIVFWRGEAVEDDGLGPQMIVALADIPESAAYGDTVTRDDVEYVVARFLPDGHGLVTVLLKD